MTQQIILKVLYAFVICLSIVNVHAQRNVILLIADDVGTDYFGFYESHGDTAAMPNIRNLIKKGVRFTNAISNPVCSPTRAGMLTGQYSFRTGIGDVVFGAQSPSLDVNEITIPKLLKTFNTNIGAANIGKWHLNLQNPSSNLLIPNKVGYDYYAGNFLGAITSYTNWPKVTNGVTSTSTTYATTDNINDAITWIKSQESNPFFVWLAFNAPHTPFHLPPAGLHSYTNLSGTDADINANPKSYFKASLEALDHEIGRLFDTLSVLNKMDSTEIIFIGDNGNGVRTAQNGNGNKSKGTIYQYGVHVPFIISGPSVINPNRVSHELVNTQDLFSTIVELFGYENWNTQIPSNKTIDSRSLIPVVKNRVESIRDWSFTEIFKTTPDSADGKSIRNRNYSLLAFDDGHKEFYNLLLDSLENNNLLNRSLIVDEIINYNFLCNELTILLNGEKPCNEITNSDDLNIPENLINISPNPFSVYTNIVFKNDLKNKRINIINQVGQVVKQIHISGKNLLLTAKDLGPGIYFLQWLENDGRSKFAKIVVQ